MKQYLFEAMETLYRRIEPRSGQDELKMFAGLIDWAKKLEAENKELRAQIVVKPPNLWTTEIPVGMKVGSISFVPADHQ